MSLLPTDATLQKARVNNMALQPIVQTGDAGLRFMALQPESAIGG